LPGSEEERAQKILKALEKTRPERAPRRYGSFLLILTFLLVVAIVAVLATNWPKFSLIWTQLTRPDSLIGSP
jgi:hypothetical protein